MLQVFYRAHIIGATLFVAFGIVHSRKVWVSLSAGLVLYGIDIAYRLLQTTRTVSIHVNPGSSMVSVVIPLEVLPQPPSILPMHFALPR